MCRRRPGSACTPGLSIARGLFLRLRGSLVVLRARPPDGATQEVGLLVRLLEAIATARLGPTASLRGLGRALGGAFALLVGLLAPLALAVPVAAVAISTIPVTTVTVAAIPITAVATIAIVAVAEAALVAAEVPIMAPAAALVRPGVASLLMPRLGLRLEHRRRLQAVVEQIVTVLLAEVLAAFARPPGRRMPLPLANSPV
jgi:hypothetical protein